MPEFVPVLRVEELSSRAGAAVEVGARSIALFVDGDALHALDDMCPHSGGPLSEGPVEDGCVACPWHGARFELATGRAVGELRCGDVLRHEARIVDGVIEVALVAQRRSVRDA